MPNPELSQYHDHDTDTVYDYKDGQSRERITELEKYRYKIVSVYTMVVGGYTQDRRGFIFDIYHRVNDSYFTRNYDGSCIRCIFPPRTLDYDPDADLYFSTGVYQEQRIMPVYKDVDQTTPLQWGDVNGLVVDFVFRVSGDTGYFVVLSSPSSVNASNVLYDNAISGLSAGNVQDAIDEVNAEKIGDNPTFTEAATRQNIASGETFAVILGKIKKFFSDLKAVAFSGSYNDLTDTPTIPDISTKMDKSNPTGSGKLSINRLLNSVEGAGSSTIGYDSTASGNAAVGSGYQTIASGDFSQANNYQTQANGDASTSHGWNTIADSDFQFVSGKYNVADNADTYVEIIGNGTNSNARSNARTLDWNGNETIAGDFYFNGNNAALSSQLSDKADASALATVATSGDYDDLLNKPTIPAAQVQSDWAQSNSGAVDYIKNKPSLATVATSGDYNDLINKLSAGTNISISASNEISATDTKPSDFDVSTFSVTANHNTTTSFKSKTLAKGIYICVGCAQFASNAAGIRSISFKVNGADNDNYAFVMNAVSGAKTYTQIVMVFNLTQTSNTVVFQGYQNSGVNSNLAVTGMFETIKIL